ncbi:MAG: hypothetical protein IT583_03655 [Verrucomicrobia bacterium]|nr:hypothetical protein [Verrucomicrobiota bacterium]
MSKDEILKELRERTKINNLALPKHLQLEEQDGLVTLFLATKEGSAPRGVTANMQQDASAFEGWAVGLKAAVPEWSFCLKWAAPKNAADGHYQRFLYRAKKFSTYYSDWFSIAPGCSTQALLIKDHEKYLLNAPSEMGNGRTNDSTCNAENFIENKIIKDEDSPLKHAFKIDKLYRQLPVGVFCGKVEKKNAIFTRGKSAVDIWGITSEDALVVFELKAPRNEKVGAISELFFYAMVLADEQAGLLIRKKSPGELIRNTTSLKAMLLASAVHPLITNKVFDLLNAPFKRQDAVLPKIEFGYEQLPTKYTREF